VTGIDIATNLLEQARQRATTEGLEIDFREGDAEELPLGDNEFDVVLSMFGAMFAPRPERVAAELLRVCRPGGTVAMANWTATGFVGEVFRVTSETTPPPPGMPAPILWGDESVVRQRFSQGTANVKTSRQLIPMHFLFPPQKVVALFREYFGPTKVAFSRLDDSGKTAFAQRLEAVWNKHNQAHDGTTKIDAEYLDVRVQKA
jgi:ubiquinone/menaquinone biosynthesis C-methylase UbiE